jgi:AcrR family transcriptional regulator
MTATPPIATATVTATATATATAADPAAPDAAPFRQRLIDGLAVAIRERGYRETTVADIVRHARTSRRTFYAEFSTKDECYVALLRTSNQKMRHRIESSVDQAAPWREQVRQAVGAYIEAVASEPEIMVSWIRELPALGTVARTVQREAMDMMTEMLLTLTDTEVFRTAGVGPLSRPMALLLLGGIRELTATTVEDGAEVRDLAEVATVAATALLASKDAA